MKKLLTLALALIATPNFAQVWDGDGVAPTVIWDTSGILGNGVAQTCSTGEQFTADQGGCPPAVANEPAAIDEGGRYTRTQWFNTAGPGTCIETNPANAHYGEDTGCRPWHGEDKFRITCGYSHSNNADFILAPGNPVGPHRHTYFGNEGIDQNSTFNSMRTAPKSTCAGGPNAASGYWKPEIIYEPRPGVKQPVMPEGMEAYYSNDPRDSYKLVRLLRGLTVIMGKNPADPKNTARLNELAAQPPAPGQTWQLRDNQEGFPGWKCVRRSPQATILTATGAEFTKSWLTLSGGDPWAGACEGANFQIWSYVYQPTCWDGKHLTSPNGRDHWRYPVIYNGVEYCPRNWRRTPGLTNIHFYPAHTHAMRRKMYLSCNRMGNNPRYWTAPGDCEHADWKNGWDDVTFKMIQQNCMRLNINGVIKSTSSDGVAQGRTCDTNIIADNTALKTSTPPDLTGTLSRNPIVSQPNLGAAPASQKFGKVLPPSAAVSSSGHTH